MDKCKYCQQELDEGTTLCPHCGKDNAEETVAAVVEETAPAAETVEAKVDVTVHVEKKATPGKIALAVTAVVVLVAILVALIAAGMKGKNGEPAETAVADSYTEETVPPTTAPDGNPDDVTAKGSYTVTDEEAKAAKDIVVATIGDQVLTNGVLQVHYWSAVNSFMQSQQGYYLMATGGLDYLQPLDTQRCAVDATQTWQQQFLLHALRNWQTSCALAAEAEKAGMEMSQEERDSIDTMEQSLTATAGMYGMTLEELLAANVGPGAGLTEFVSFQEQYSRGSGYYQSELAKLQPTDADLEAFFAAHEQEYAQGGVTKDSKFVDVRHILITPEGGETGESGATVYSDEAWQNCEANAQSVLDAWLAGEKTEDSFAALANEKSMDPGSNTTGGLYENVFEGQMVKPFEEWCFDNARQPGDYGMVKTDYGYHVMFFVDSTPQWTYYTEQDWRIDQTNKFIESLIENYPMEVDYKNISLGYLEMG